jgi:predicted ATPase
MTFGSFALWAQGYPDTALARGQETLALAQELSHPYSVALALQIVALLHQFRREVDQTREQADALIALSTQHGFPPYLVLGTLLRAWVRAQGDEPQEAVADLREGIAAWSGLGVELVRSYYALLLADAQMRAGQVDEALATVTEAIKWADGSQERVFVAELYRVLGILMWVLPSAAEEYLIRARDIARAQGAKMLELRAIVSLSRLWMQQDRHQEARDDLGAIYAGFREGFALADLQEAAELLAELNASSGLAQSN